MEFCIDGNNLRRALHDIESAEDSGFNYCLAVFELTQKGTPLYNCQASYSDLLERAHPTNGHMNWGRFQGMAKICKFVDGQLVPIEMAEVRNG